VALQEIVQIAAPPALVWSLIDDPARLPLWMPDVLETVYPNGRPKTGAVGTRFIQKVRDGRSTKEYRGVVTAFDAGRLLGIELVDGSYKIDVTYKLSPNGDGTQLDYRGALTMHNALLQMMAAMAWPMTRSILLGQVARLKTVAEAEAIKVPTPKKRMAPVSRKPTARKRKTRQ
jgi:uncharacterized protein YndB with AHSA1/START domain